MLDLTLMFAAGMSAGAWLVLRFMVPVAYQAGLDQSSPRDRGEG